MPSGLFRLCCHFVGSYGLARCEEFSISIVCIYYSTHRCQVRKEQMLGDYSCLGQINGCGPSCPSSHSFVFIPGTVNTDDQNPFRIKMPNVCKHSLALQYYLLELHAKQEFLTTADHVKTCLDWSCPSETWTTVFTEYPNLRYPFICLALLRVKVMLQM